MNVVSSSRGFALITALVFLIVLTLIAVGAIRSGGLELKMGANTAIRTEAFEASESPRMMVSNLIDVHAFNRGWPASYLGGVPDTLFNYSIPKGLCIATPATGCTSADVPNSTPADWFAANNDAAFDPKTLLWDTSYSHDAALGSGNPPYMVNANMAVYKMRTDLAPGSGAAQVAGYEGLGKGAAGGGGNIFFYVLSRGTDASNQSPYLTAAAYRFVIRN